MVIVGSEHSLYLLHHLDWRLKIYFKNIFKCIFTSIKQTNIEILYLT